MCRVNSYKANYRHSTVQIIIIITIIIISEDKVFRRSENIDGSFNVARHSFVSTSVFVKYLNI
jgi:hypothetical protein